MLSCNGLTSGRDWSYLIVVYILVIFGSHEERRVEKIGLETVSLEDLHARWEPPLDSFRWRRLVGTED